jgi:hypothetical protein
LLSLSDSAIAAAAVETMLALRSGAHSVVHTHSTKIRSRTGIGTGADVGLSVLNASYSEYSAYSEHSEHNVGGVDDRQMVSAISGVSGEYKGSDVRDVHDARDEEKGSAVSKQSDHLDADTETDIDAVIDVDNQAQPLLHALHASRSLDCNLHTQMSPLHISLMHNMPPRPPMPPMHPRGRSPSLQLEQREQGGAWEQRGDRGVWEQGDQREAWVQREGREVWEGREGRAWDDVSSPDEVSSPIRSRIRATSDCIEGRACFLSNCKLPT